MPLIKAVILIGGPQKGTRFRPLSLDHPKPLFPVTQTFIDFSFFSTLHYILWFDRIFKIKYVFKKAKVLSKRFSALGT